MKKNFSIIFSFYFFIFYSQKIKVLNIKGDSISIRIENPTSKNLILYPNSFILNSDILKKKKGKAIYSFIYSNNMKNNSYSYYLENENDVKNMEYKYNISQRDAVYFAYVISNKVIIPKKAKNFVVSFRIYNCPLDNTSKKMFKNSYSPSNKYYLNGKINFLAESYFPKEYIDEMRKEDNVFIKEIKFCNIPLVNPDNLFCDQEL